ncbi:hypothetical protein C1646_770690 [Rhizophagus diaphanus]|nr:hypothetical protein C1646_770690 [Rhizophagus diaphanus] [Rhizophagus sp. MUCL 43196]
MTRWLKVIRYMKIYNQLKNIDGIQQKFSTPILGGIAQQAVYGFYGGITALPDTIFFCNGNKDIDELMQHSQLNVVHYLKCLEWIPFEKFQNVTYITGKQNKSIQRVGTFNAKPGSLKGKNKKS